MVREANGQNKLRFSQVFWTLILVVTLSHDFSKCGNILQLYKDLLKMRSFSFTVRFCIYFCSSLFSAVLFGGYSTLGFSFEVEVTDIYFSYRSSWHPFVIILSFFPSLQLFICFHAQAGDFPRCGDFPSVFRCQRSSSFLFQSNKQADFNAHFSTVRKNNFIFSVPYFFLSFPTGTRTSLQVEYNSYVLVGGIGSLLQFFCLCLYSINITSIIIKCF